MNNWSRECLMKNTLSDDIIDLISMFTMKDKRDHMMERNMHKLELFLEDAEQEYRNRLHSSVWSQYF